MDRLGHQKWLRVALLFGIVYLVVGVGFAELAKTSASDQMRVTWRLAAWLVSAAAFAVHIWYEHIRLCNSPRTSALHVSLAAAVGAFALAVSANIHAHVTASGNPTLLALALVLWPVLTGVPAFLVALATTALLARWRRIL